LPKKENKGNAVEMQALNKRKQAAVLYLYGYKIICTVQYDMAYGEHTLHWNNRA
jgi:hypothetical protein